MAQDGADDAAAARLENVKIVNLLVQLQKLGGALDAFPRRLKTDALLQRALPLGDGLCVALRVVVAQPAQIGAVHLLPQGLFGNRFEKTGYPN